MDLLKDLEFRGLLNQATDQEELGKRLSEGRITLYCGFDPTADSLHIGNLVSILMLKRFQLAGHRPLALVGGATGLIGDPSGKANERTLNTQDVVKAWSEKIRSQLSRFLDFEAKENGAKVVNNYDWLGEMNLITFLRDIGKNFSLNYMLSKESVDSRLATGISFTEFSYMILQSIDFLELYRQEGCRLQVGGSDQWGNITAGLELIRRSGEEDRAYGLTTPLVTKSDGTKFGKTESGTIWLDAERTSPYEFYQFWLNTDDRDVVPFLKYFTFLSKDEILALEEELQTAPEKRAAQGALAREMTTLVHGQAALEQAVRISAALFSGEIGELTAEEIAVGFKDVPSYTLASKDEIGLLDLLVESGVSPSKRQAREDIGNGAIYINGERIQALDFVVGAGQRIGDQFVLIRRGKKNYTLIRYQ